MFVYIFHTQALTSRKQPQTVPAQNKISLLMHNSRSISNATTDTTPRVATQWQSHFLFLSNGNFHVKQMMIYRNTEWEFQSLLHSWMLFISFVCSTSYWKSLCVFEDSFKLERHRCIWNTVLDKIKRLKLQACHFWFGFIFTNSFMSSLCRHLLDLFGEGPDCLCMGSRLSNKHTITCQD